MTSSSPQERPEGEREKRTVLAPRFGAKGWLRWRIHEAIGGDRPEDKRLRKRLIVGGSGATVSGLLITAIVRIWLHVLEPQLTTQAASQVQRDKDLTAALSDLAGGVKAGPMLQAALDSGTGSPVLVYLPGDIYNVWPLSANDTYPGKNCLEIRYSNVTLMGADGGA